MPRATSSRLRDRLQEWIALPTVTTAEMIGVWHGWAYDRESLFATLLSESSWLGKVFRSREDVDALVFGSPRTLIGVVNRLMIAPFRLPEDRRLVRHPLGAATLEDRVLYGRRSAAMCYRLLPIVDHFRRICDRRVMGLMQIAGRTDPELFFALERRAHTVR